MPRKKQQHALDSFHYHEALDRTYVITDMINVHLAGHPVYTKHKELSNRVKKAEILLIEAYQLIPNLELLEENQYENKNKNSTRRNTHPKRKK